MSKRPYIFLSDLDGTLLTTDKKVTPGIRDALDNFVMAGNIFAICTGRAMQSAMNIYKSCKLNYPNSFVVAYNGGEIYSKAQDKVIFRSELELEMVNSIWELADSLGLYIQAYTDDYIIAKKYGKELDFYRHVIRTPVIITDNPEAEMPKPPCKMLAIDLTGRDNLEKFREILKREFGDALKTMYSSDYYLEVVPSNTGKGDALKFLCKYLDLPIERSIAAGDADNDADMIAAAGTGIAMCTGSDLAKSFASIITKQDSDHDGLAEYLNDSTYLF